MRTAMIIVLAGTALVWAGPQDEAPPRSVSTEPAPNEAAAEDMDDDVLITASELRGRVRDMRKTVLGGGPAVEKAEREALGFYRRKVQQNLRRIDELHTTRDAKDAEYQLALDATLEAEDGDTRVAAARRASKLKTEMGNIDAEMDDLNRQRKALDNAVAATESRIKRRKRIIEHFDEGETVDTLPFLGEDVLGPDDEMGDEDPFADDTFLEDLMARDPEQARAVLIDLDPVRYWKLFPLTPPESALRTALTFPPPDFPGKR